MKNRIKNTLLLTVTAVLCLLAQGVFAQKQTPPEGGQPKDFVLPEKKVNELDNGLKSTLVNYGALPKATVMLIIRTGNINEQADQVWLADLMGDLMEEGTAQLDANALAEKVASMGGNLNISVGQNQITISGSVLSEFTDDLIRTIADVVMHPAFPQSEIDRLKNDMKRNLSVQKSRPQAQAMEKFYAALYPDQPQGRIFPTEEMIDGYSVENVKDFYTKNVGAQRSSIYVAGKFAAAGVEKAIEESFRDWIKGPAIDMPVAQPDSTASVALIDRSGAPQSTIMLGLPVIDPSNPDYIPLTLTNALLGGSFASRITSNIREDKGYTYSPFSNISNGYKSGVWYEQADITTENTGDALREILKEINTLQEEPPTTEELEGIKNYQAGIFVLQNSSASGIIGQLSFLDFHGLDESYLTNMVENIHSVSPEEIQAMTKKYIRPEDMTLVVVGDKKVLDEQIKEYENKISKQ